MAPMRKLTAFSAFEREGRGTEGKEESIVWPLARVLGSFAVLKLARGMPPPPHWLSYSRSPHSTTLFSL